MTNTMTTTQYPNKMYPDTDLGQGMTAQEQRIERPNIEDVVCHYLDGDTLKGALAFINNVYVNKMKIRWVDVNAWTVHYRWKHICDIVIEKGVLKVQYVQHYVPEEDHYVHDAESMMNLITTLRSAVVGPQKAYSAAH